MGNYLDVRSIVEGNTQKKVTQLLDFDSIPEQRCVVYLIMNGVMFDRLLCECNEVNSLPENATYSNCEATLRKNEIYVDESIPDNVVLAALSEHTVVEVFKLVEEAAITAFSPTRTQTHKGYL